MNLTHHSKSKVRIILIASGLFLVTGFLLIFSFARAAEDRTLPGLFIGDISIGQMSKVELKEFLDSMSTKLSTEGIEFQLKHPSGTHTFTLMPEIVGESDIVDYIYIDTKKETDRIFSLGKEKNILSNAFVFIQAHLNKKNIEIQNISFEKERMYQALQQESKAFEKPPQDAELVFSDFEPLRYTLTSSSPGFVYNFESTFQSIEKSAKNLKRPVVVLEAVSTSPKITQVDWQPVLSAVSTTLSFGPLVLSYVDEAGDVQKEWKIPVSVFSSWFTLGDLQGQKALSLDRASTTEYLVNKINSAIAEEPEDAKFTVDEQGRVKEFQASKVGVGLDIQKTYDAIQLSLEQRVTSNTSTPIRIILTQVEPNIATGQVNDLGIKEILGVGISNFAGSPSNRIKNIRNAVNKLNGLLIKPGDEFSAIKYTQPYTIEGGYLPEKVIKGDELKAEIGGGLCQVGTTLFRMAMNSGLEITERRNHSLVVSYYNDLSNGLPGTDATLYDPSPDFRFKNDTNNYVLIQSSMNEKTGELKFTIWGTSDGRKGSYSKPVVHKWIPAGPARVTETTSLAPGERQCQNAFRGAQTSFTYTRIMSDGAKQETVFDSYYRPLPQICLVGVEKASAPCPEGEVCSVPEIIEDPAPTPTGVENTTASST